MKLFARLSKGAEALAELQQKYPNVSVAELIKVLKQSKGDPAKAAAAIGAMLSSGGGKKPGSAPDIRTDPGGWFRFYDEDGNGLAQYEVEAAIAETFRGAERGNMVNIVRNNWRRFDPDGSGTISIQEFLQPNGLRDLFVRALGGGHSAASASAGGGYPAASAHAGGPSAGPFVPPGRPSAFGGGRRKALLIGINYVGQRAQLKGCVNDVKNMQRLLTEVYRWDPRCIRTLTDDQATHRNIMAEMQRLVEGARPHDAFIFHFSGHGAQQEDPHGYEEDGMNETIIPVDFQNTGMITDDKLTEVMIQPLPEGCRFTAVMDCCHSGTGLDLPFMHTGGRGGGRDWKQEPNPFFTACDAQLFSGCDDDQTSADVQGKYQQPGGAMTTALCEELRANPQPSYTDLINNMNRTMKKRGFKQRPQLSSSQAFQFPRTFTLTDANPNMNQRLGRVVDHGRFKPNPRPIGKDDPLAEMLGPLGMMALEGAAMLGGKKVQQGVDLLRAALNMAGK